VLCSVVSSVPQVLVLLGVSPMCAVYALLFYPGTLSFRPVICRGPLCFCGQCLVPSLMWCILTRVFWLACEMGPIITATRTEALKTSKVGRCGVGRGFHWPLAVTGLPCWDLGKRDWQGWFPWNTGLGRGLT